MLYINQATAPGQTGLANPLTSFTLSFLHYGHIFTLLLIFYFFCEYICCTGLHMQRLQAL